MLSNQVLTQPFKRVNIVNTELNNTSSKRYLDLYFIWANLEICNLRIYRK